MNIRAKLVSVLVPLGIIGASIGAVTGFGGTSALEDSSRNSLASVREFQKRAVEEYFETINGQIRTLANDQMVIDAMREFRVAFNEYSTELPGANSPESAANMRSTVEKYYSGDFPRKFDEVNPDTAPDMLPYLNSLNSRTIALQYSYIAANPNPLGSKDDLMSSADGTTYSKLHAEYHPHIRDFLKTFGYYDIFLVDDRTGEIIYSVYKELDFATSLLNGPYAESGIGETFQAANSLSMGQIAVTDFKPYLPSYNASAGFFGTPIYDGETKIGVLIFQAPLDKLSELMTFGHKWREHGLGESGETYIVASDYTLRNNSRFLIEDSENYFDALAVGGERNVDEIRLRQTSVGLQHADTQGTRAALSGETGFAIFPDYRGIEVLSAYAPLDIPGLDWVLMAEIDEAEAFATARDNKQAVAIGALAIGMVVLIGAVLLVRSITRPVTQLQGAMQKLTEGDDSVRADLNSGDELEELGNVFNRLLDDRFANMVEANRLNERLNTSVVTLLDGVSRLSEKDLTTRLQVAEDVTGPISDAMNMMTSETSKVLNSIKQIAADVENGANTVRSQGDAVAGVAAEERKIVGETLEQLDAIAEQMSSIASLADQCNQIAQQASDSTNSALDSVSDTASGMGNIRETISETEKRIKRLGERSMEINGIVEIINGIAERTHVLALNASMQAASAGEAGRGFSVVADEVQRLAESSRESTSEIQGLVTSIQTEAADTMAMMNKTIDEVVSGTELAEKSGQQMRQTKSTAENLAKLVSDIAGQSVSQAESCNSLRDRAGDLVSQSQKTGEALSAQASVTERLVDYSKLLLDSVSVFKLPAAIKINS